MRMRLWARTASAATTATSSKSHTKWPVDGEDAITPTTFEMAIPKASQAAFPPRSQRSSGEEDEAGAETDAEHVDLDPALDPDQDVDESLPVPILPAPVTAPLPSVSSGRRRQATAQGTSLRTRPRNARFSVLAVHWAQLRRRIGTGTAPSTSSMDGMTADSSQLGRMHLHRSPNGRDIQAKDNIDEDWVDHVVVERNWEEEYPYPQSRSHSEPGAGEKGSGGNGTGNGRAEHGYGAGEHTTSVDHESFSTHGQIHAPGDGIWTSSTLLIILRYRLWPLIFDFFSSGFDNAESEAHYRKENWFIRKPLALWSSVFLVINWTLGIAFIQRPLNQLDEAFYYGAAVFFTFPLLAMVMWDFPRDRPLLYQCFLACSIWSWSFYSLLSIFLCGYYDKSRTWIDCGNKDFLTTF